MWITKVQDNYSKLIRLKPKELKIKKFKLFLENLL